MDETELTTEELLQMWQEGEPVELVRPNHRRSSAGGWDLRGCSDARASHTYVRINVEKQGVLAISWRRISGQTEAAVGAVGGPSNRLVGA